MKIDISKLNDMIVEDSHGYYVIKRIHTSPIIKNQFTDVWLMSTDKRDVKVLKKLDITRDMPKYFLNCVRYCEKNRNTIENDWKFFQDDTD